MVSFDNTYIVMPPLCLLMTDSQPPQRNTHAYQASLTTHKYYNSTVTTTFSQSNNVDHFLMNSLMLLDISLKL